MNKFPERITDHVFIAWSKGVGSCAIALDDSIFPILDFSQVNFQCGFSYEEVRHYVGIMFCNWLKNRASKETILNDNWMNVYLSKTEILRCFDIIEANVKINL